MSAPRDHFSVLTVTTEVDVFGGAFLHLEAEVAD